MQDCCFSFKKKKLLSMQVLSSGQYIAEMFLLPSIARNPSLPLLIVANPRKQKVK